MPSNQIGAFSAMFFSVVLLPVLSPVLGVFTTTCLPQKTLSSYLNYSKQRTNVSRWGAFSVFKLGENRPNSQILNRQNGIFWRQGSNQVLWTLHHPRARVALLHEVYCGRPADLDRRGNRRSEIRLIFLYDRNSFSLKTVSKKKF